MTTADPDVVRLEQEEVPDCIKLLINDGNKMNSKYRIGNSAFGFPSEQEAEEDEIHVLIQLPKQEAPPSSFPLPTYMNGIDMTSQGNLRREDLVTKLYDLVVSRSGRFVRLSSPAASGKTSLLALFANRYRDRLSCIYVKEFQTLIRQLVSGRVTGFDAETVTFQRGKLYVIQLDDAQKAYSDYQLWENLIKAIPAHLQGYDVRFIISASHTLIEGDVSTPLAIRDFPGLTRSDFLLHDKQAMEFLALPEPNGLPPAVGSKLREVIVSECNGLIGALRIAVDQLANRFKNRSSESETEVLNYYLSTNFVHQLGRCFGFDHAKPIGNTLKNIIFKCLADEPIEAPTHLDEDQD